MVGEHSMKQETFWKCSGVYFLKEHNNIMNEIISKSKNMQGAYNEKLKEYKCLSFCSLVT